MLARLLVLISVAVGVLAPTAAASELPQQADWGSDSASRQAPAGNGNPTGGGGSVHLGGSPATAAMDSGSAATASGSRLSIDVIDVDVPTRTGALKRRGVSLRFSCSERCRLSAAVRIEGHRAIIGSEILNAGSRTRSLRLDVGSVAARDLTRSGLRLDLRATAASDGTSTRMLFRGL